MLIPLAVALAAGTNAPCPGETLSFDGACRSFSFFEDLAADGWNLVAVEGSGFQEENDWIALVERKTSVVRHVVLTADATGYTEVARVRTRKGVSHRVSLAPSGTSHIDLVSRVSAGSGSFDACSTLLGTVAPAGPHGYEVGAPEVDGDLLCWSGPVLGVVDTDFLLDIVDTDFLLDLVDSDFLLDFGPAAWLGASLGAGASPTGCRVLGGGPSWAPSGC
jgi:hypothetical protein